MIVDATRKKKTIQPCADISRKKVSLLKKPLIYCSLFTFPARGEIELENSARKKTETRRSVSSGIQSPEIGFSKNKLFLVRYPKLGSFDWHLRIAQLIFKNVWSSKLKNLNLRLPYLRFWNCDNEIGKTKPWHL